MKGLKSLYIMKNKGASLIYTVYILFLITNFLSFSTKYIIYKKKIINISITKLNKENLKKRILKNEINNLDLNLYEKLSEKEYERNLLFYNIKIYYSNKLEKIEVIEIE